VLSHGRSFSSDLNWRFGAAAMWHKAQEKHWH
jgi:hypothetical protein